VGANNRGWMILYVIFVGWVGGLIVEYGSYVSVDEWKAGLLIRAWDSLLL